MACVFHVGEIGASGPWVVVWVFFQCYVVNLLGFRCCFFFPWSCVGEIMGVGIVCVDCVCVVVARCFNVF